MTYDSFPPKSVQLVVLSKSSLSETVQALNEQGITCTLSASGDYYVITKTEGRKTYFYCNSSGCPYVASKSPAAADNNFNYIVNNNVDNSQDNSVTVDTSIIDIGDKTMNVINDNGEKIEYNIDSLYFDASTSTYTANTYQYDITNNTYNYYTWNITYNITNTYINYIGSNDAYQQEEYKYYYELPDGRSSADLTADEVAGMSFQFADVVNYARSATDTSLRALYHFDGNTEDSGYFSTQTEFKWTQGASITYMDSAAFNGALYLDETAHAFDITLPSNLGSGDFSLQFRHYQASQPDTVSNINNSLSIGGTKILRWDERNFYFSPSGSTVTCAVPVGSWAEIALVRHNGTLYFYINGLKVASKADTTGYQGKLSFALGTTSRAYTMLDELRVVNFAIAEGGASYTCTTVPYDTNLVLVLPDSAFPIADEYWEFNSTGNIFKGYDFTTGAVVLPGNHWSSRDVSISYFSDCVRITPNYTSSTYQQYLSNRNFLSDSSHLGLFSYVNPLSHSWSAGTYTFSVMLSDGSVFSVPFTVDNLSHVTENVFQEFSWGSLYIYSVYGYKLDGFLILPKPDMSIDVIYAEVVQGPANTGHEKVSCIYSSEEVKPNTAAVQSSIPVTGYTVGGVRPTFPARGNVWFPVEGSRISGCYIYDGSMWRSAGARYYTGKRWIPIYAFDIFTLQDCWDIADKEDATPPITTETGFWNWFKSEWNDFRKWGDTSVEAIITAITAGGGSAAPPEEDCQHTYHYKDITPAACTTTGTRLFTCTKCADTYAEETNALGHDWIQIDDIQDGTDEAGNAVRGYALWECTRCKKQHKDYERTGPPPDETDSTITTQITNLFDKLGSLGGELLDWLFGLATEAMDGLGNIGDYFKEKSQEVEGVGGGFLLFLSAAFEIIPPELMTCMSLAIIFLALGLFVKKVLLK